MSLTGITRVTVSVFMRSQQLYSMYVFAITCILETIPVETIICLTFTLSLAAQFGTKFNKNQRFESRDFPQRNVSRLSFSPFIQIVKKTIVNTR